MTTQHCCSTKPWVLEEAGVWERTEAVSLAFFSLVPFLSEYFGHCHVLLGTFEKVGTCSV
jgi:hypothetical protein